MSEEQNIAIIKRLVDIVNERKLDQLAEFTHSDFKRHDKLVLFPRLPVPVVR